MTQALTRATRRALVLAATVLSALALSSCSGHHMGSMGGAHSATSATPSYGPAATGAHNAQDVTFLADMVPHHTQAVVMADLALSRDTDADVKALATQIKAAQGPEIAQMGGWLLGWGQAVSTGSPGVGGTGHSMAGTGHGGGMMTGTEMTQLEASSGTAFAKLFLHGMTKHHEGAVEMARTQLAHGQNAQVKRLASGILSAQQQEITTMRALLAKLG